MGPTASGKTNLAVELVQHFPFEIISVDSAMVYRGMDIGTAKPDKNVLEIAPHRLIDILDPAQSYSAAKFCQDVQREMDDIESRGKIPLLVGGTMMYFRALQQGLSQLPSQNPEIRAFIQDEAKLLGWESLHARLLKIDPEAAIRIHPNDAQRIQRVLEVFELTGKNMTDHIREDKSCHAGFKIISMGLIPGERHLLHERIAHRFKKMIKEGFVEEVESLYHRGDLNLQMPSMRAVGYRQVWEYLQGFLKQSEMEEKGIIATRQLAKRQLTWLRHWQDLKIFDPENPSQIFLEIKEYIEQHFY